MTVYEEVAKMPPFHRKTLVLVGEDIPKTFKSSKHVKKIKKTSTRGYCLNATQILVIRI